ncbi:uncharacterized protein LOC112499813 isoform X1 [Cynara cardunculus var. scolymus]|uniref:uncharacterized protein LOC112499813 isoform X1 n=2 Tax=Cynara cardunculus var. scolymus TaxID=59895 RepID=UPI000D62A74C|nr:uncharacterized protein LOC112499813 isoform X1 [Cynara cardunculus var. scolymus]XP_024958853.1 uncharacterized protein LOC112499813 isoform X1 [Cynara cardunculus var. scolymus]
MAWRGSISRALMSTARTSSFRSTAPLPRLRPPPISAPRLHSRRLGNPRTLGELGCAQSLLPLAAGVRLTSHLTVNVRAFCELSHGTFCRSCQDR